MEWKSSVIVPVPKKSSAKVLNEFQPTALTSILCKCLERVVCNQLTASVVDRMHSLQFAYRAKRGVDDATLTLLDLVARHIHTSDFCSNPVHGFLFCV